jgi:hypothetical protein
MLLTLWHVFGETTQAVEDDGSGIFKAFFRLQQQIQNEKQKRKKAQLEKELLELTQSSEIKQAAPLILEYTNDLNETKKQEILRQVNAEINAIIAQNSIKFEKARQEKINLITKQNNFAIILSIA